MKKNKHNKNEKEDKKASKIKAQKDNKKEAKKKTKVAKTQVDNETKDLKKVEKQVNVKARNIVFNIMAVVCIALYAISFAPKTLQNDTFYTLKIGEWISQNGISNLTEDNYSWQELPYTYPHWLYDLSLFLIYNSFGHLGVYISTMVLFAILGISIYMNSIYKSKNKIISLILTVFAMYLCKDYVAARAQLVTFCLFSFEIFFTERFLDTHKKRYAIPLFIIPILITNLHCAVFPFYFILLLPYIVEYLWAVVSEKNVDFKILKVALKVIMRFVPSDETYAQMQKKVENIPDAIEKEKVIREEKRKNPYKICVEKNSFVKWLIVIFIITAFTGFLNPAGTGAYTYTYKIYQGNTTNSINEHQPLVLIDYKEYLIGIATFLVILMLTDTKIKLRDLFMVAGLTLLSLMSKRQVSMVLIFCVPILVKVISDFIAKYDIDTYKKIFNVVSSYACIAIIVLGFGIFTTKKINDNLSNVYVDTASYPEGASNWILANLDVNNIRIFNEYNYGSYLLFKGIPVFIDSRCDLYTPEFNGKSDIFSDALDCAGVGNSDFEYYYKKYDITHIVVPSNARILMFIRGNDSYKKLYEDSSFVVYERLDATKTKNDEKGNAQEEVPVENNIENVENNLSEK